MPFRLFSLALNAFKMIVDIFLTQNNCDCKTDYAEDLLK